MTVSTAQGYETYVRVKLENSSDNWYYNETCPRDPYFRTAPFDSSVDMTRLYAIGTRSPIDTVEGVIEITGSIERPLFDTAEDNQFVWDGNQEGNGTSFNLADVCGLYGTNVSKCAILIRPFGTTVNMTWRLGSVKFHDYSFALEAEGTLMESASYTVDNVSSAG